MRNLVGSGATAIGRANYGDMIGEYYTAFFGLSIGMERLAKLILVTNHAIVNGALPDEKVVRKFGHRLTDLMNATDAVAQQHNVHLEFPRPTTPISRKIIERLDAFADAGRGRYANFADLGTPKINEEEPISKWWDEVAELILQKHYFGKAVQKRVEGRAQFIDAVLSPHTSVHHTNESGVLMKDVLSSSIRAGQATIVQKYGRYYALTVIRWLAELLSTLSEDAANSHNMDAFYGLGEHFQSYTVEDVFLRTRKKWPL